MDRPATYQFQLDAAAASAASLFRSSRSCVVVLTNCTSIAWKLTSVNVRRGGLASQPPPKILPWCFAVFGAQSLAAHAGAGCNGVVRYASRSGHLALELRYDVPYAGATAAHLDVRGPYAHSIETSVRSRDGDGYGKAFFLRIVSRNGPSHQLQHGVPSP
jgi:hypothetical protein